MQRNQGRKGLYLTHYWILATASSLFLVLKSCIQFYSHRDKTIICVFSRDSIIPFDFSDCHVSKQDMVTFPGTAFGSRDIAASNLLYIKVIFTIKKESFHKI
jgi:hypothetical protein